MGTMKITVSADVSGPLSDGRAEKAVQDWQKRTTQALGDKGVELLRAVKMDKTGRAHGAFQEALHTVRTSVSEMTVPGPQESGVVWSPWLEGTTQRNESTGFKGYGLFRKTRAKLSKLAPEIGQQQLDAVMSEIGGG